MTDAPAVDAYDRLPDAAAELFGEEATAEYAYDLLTVDVPAASWIAALETARDALGCTYFDWLSAVDEPGTGFRVCAHVAALAEGRVRRLLIRTTVAHDAAVLPTAIDVYAGAAWHERETHEMFGIGFEGHPHLVPLLLPEGFEGHPLRKDFVLAARVAKAWPGAKEPGESEHGGPKRRTMLPPGVPDPNEWGPLKGQLPPAPSRPARTPRAAGDRPVRRARSVSEGSASRQPEPTAPTAGATPPATPRRTRSASQGSASQQRDPAKPATTAPATTASATAAPAASAPAASAPATAAPAASAPAASAPATTAPAASAPAASGTTPTGSTSGSTAQAQDQAAQDQAGPGGSAQEPSRKKPAPRPGNSDAPWHHARPAYAATPEPEPSPTDGSEPEPSPTDAPEPEPSSTGARDEAAPDQPTIPAPDPASELNPDRPAGGDDA
ncbi:NADH-quinone oxidoreductase subunit C [Streptomyces sp. NPDC047515]|uniref:NADH-quinone oxidoreductase subunit C n=1 Tax=Streptomyces sp. NPDC047515 TaxID=3155380 RepID=UPI0033D94EC8